MTNAYNSRGIVKSIMGSTNEALEDFNKAIGIDNSNVDSYFNRALIYYHQKKVS